MNVTVNNLLDALNITTDKIQQREDLICALSAQVEALTKERNVHRAAALEEAAKLFETKNQGWHSDADAASAELIRSLK